MEIKNIKQLKSSEYLAVIINAGTSLSTTLTLMSVLKHVGVDVLVIDCRYGDDSYNYFLKLMKSYRFDLLSVPLQEHGRILDWLFKDICADKVFLVDSDIEILGEFPAGMMKAEIGGEDVFGSGFVHEGCWMHRQRMRYGYYEERPWIPFVLLKTGPVRQVIEKGCSFAAGKVFNDLPALPTVSRIIGSRLYVPVLRNLRLRFLDRFRKEFHGMKPSMVYYDTGAIVYRHLMDKGYRFAGLPWEVNWEHIIHFHGITRTSINRLGLNGERLGNVSGYIRERLEEVYGLDPDIPG